MNALCSVRINFVSSRALLETSPNVYATTIQPVQKAHFQQALMCMLQQYNQCKKHISYFRNHTHGRGYFMKGGSMSTLCVGAPDILPYSYIWKLQPT